jgi:hypothetical protein
MIFKLKLQGHIKLQVTDRYVTLVYKNLVTVYCIYINLQCVHHEFIIDPAGPQFNPSFHPIAKSLFDSV